MPVDRCPVTQVVLDVDGDVFTFFEPQDSRDLAVVIANAFFNKVARINANVVYRDVVGFSRSTEGTYRRDRQRKKSCTEYGFGTHFHSFQGFMENRCAEHAAFNFFCYWSFMS